MAGSDNSSKHNSHQRAGDHADPSDPNTDADLNEHRDTLYMDPPQNEADNSWRSEMETLMDRAEATMTLATAWTENLTSLVHLEFQRTLAAGKRIFVLLLLVFFLAIALLVSLCAGLGLLGYYFFQSVYAGFGIFLLAQILIVGVMLLSAHRLRRLLGFDETRKQAKEAIADVTALFKQTD